MYRKYTVFSKKPLYLAAYRRFENEKVVFSHKIYSTIYRYSPPSFPKCQQRYQRIFSINLLPSIRIYN